MEGWLKIRFLPKFIGSHDLYLSATIQFSQWNLVKSWLFSQSFSIPGAPSVRLTHGLWRWHHHRRPSVSHAWPCGWWQVSDPSPDIGAPWPTLHKPFVSFLRDWLTIALDNKTVILKTRYLSLTVRISDLLSVFYNSESVDYSLSIYHVAPANGLAPSGATSSAGTVMIKFCSGMFKNKYEVDEIDKGCHLIFYWPRH